MSQIQQAPAGFAPIGPESHAPGHAARAVAATFGIALGVVAVAAVLLYLISTLGSAGVIVAAIAALVPLLAVLLTIRWVDRWEPEPRPALVFAVLWGAGVAVAGIVVWHHGRAARREAELADEGPEPHSTNEP